MTTCLPTVRVTIVTGALARILAAIAAEPIDHVITAIADGVHNHVSAHYRGEAVDLRTRTLSPADLHATIARLETALGADYLVLYERPGDTPATSAEHLHVQLRRALANAPAFPPSQATDA